MLKYIALEIITKPTSLPNTDTDSQINKFLSIVFVTIGAVALFMLVIAGLRYMMAQGDPAKVAESKNMIIYSMIGLVIAASAAAVVNFVLGKA